MRVLISGAGIAGPCLAYWLLRYGFQPTLVERAPALRRGGYVIDFWGAGFEVAERMGLVPLLVQSGYQVREVRLVGADGRRTGGFSTAVFERLTSGRFTSLPRGELAAAVYGALGPGVETRFGDTITSLAETESGVHVEFEHSAAQVFDLVVGADGLHSRVRHLVFGEQARFAKYLGYRVAAFEARGYSPRDELTYVLYQQVGQQVARFSLRDDRTLFLFVFRDPNPEPIHDSLAAKRLLRQRFAGSGWESRAILNAMDASDDLYFDDVSQIRMPRWWKGRVALVGDAAYCPSLLAGQGSALAMVGAYVLAGELERAGGSTARAFARYEERLSSLILRKQDGAEKFAATFAPRSKFALFWRTQVTRLMSVPGVAQLALGRALRDDIVLPEY